MKILSIVGARPQFVKAAAISREVSKQIDVIMVHTGQHYDQNMSQVFFEELNIPAPAINLGIGSGSHGYQTGQMLTKLEEEIFKNSPDLILVYGDTNTTIAGALAAAKLNIPVAHVEAGLRSFNRNMPEEINRILTDHISSFLFCPTTQSEENLRLEGLVDGVFQVGDVMYDALKYYLSISKKQSKALTNLGLKKNLYILATIHRPINTDNIHRLESILKALGKLEIKVVLPLHPRTKEAFSSNHIQPGSNIEIIEPVGYLDMLELESNADCIVTDSGGVQKEAYLLGIRCVTLREETEWVETVHSGWNKLVGADSEAIIRTIMDWQPTGKRPQYFGDGTAAIKIIKIIEESIS